MSGCRAGTFRKKKLNMSTGNKLLVKIPSRERGLSWLNHWIEKTRNENTKILISLDDDDRRGMQESRTFTSERVIFHTGRRVDKIEAINRNIDLYANDFDFLLVASDDITTVDGYDDMIIQAFSETKKDVLHYGDGFRTDLITIPVMRMSYYCKFKYVFHPSYKSLWCDNEFQDVAAGNIQRRSEKIFSHNHPVNVGSRGDALFRHNEKYFQTDKKNYIDRKKRRFQ